MKKARKERVLDAATTSDYLTVEEAAKVLGIQPMVVRNYLYKGDLTTHKFKSLTLLDAKEVASRKKNKK